VWEYSGYVYLFMEACLGGELFDVIMHRCSPPPPTPHPSPPSFRHALLPLHCLLSLIAQPRTNCQKLCLGTSHLKLGDFS